MSPVRCILIAALIVVSGCGDDDDDGAVDGWTLGFGGAGTDAPNAIGVAPNGDVIVAGFFSDSVAIGDLQLASANAWDGFVLATTSSGEPRWATRFGGMGNDMIGGLTVLDDGSIVVVGTFKEKLDLGSDTVSTLGGTDVFVALLDSDGEPQWIRSFGGPGDDFGRAATPAGDGGFFMAGEFSETAGFDETLRVDALGELDVFHAKLDADGEPQWVHSVGARGFDGVSAMTATPNGGYALAGTFESNVVFAGEELMSQGSFDGFVAAYDAAGEALWARAIGDFASDRISAVASNDAGLVAIAGEYEGTVDLGGGDITSELTDAYVAVYDADGAYQWSSLFGGAGFATGNAVAFDLDGELSYAGGFFGDLDACGQTHTAFGENDVAAARFDATGACKWVQRFGGVEDDIATSIATDVTGTPVLAGRFRGSGNFAYATLESAGGFDIFLLTLPQRAE